MAIVACSGVAFRHSVRVTIAAQTSSMDNDHGPGVTVMLREDVPSAWEYPLLEYVASLDFARRQIFCFPARDVVRRLVPPKPAASIPSTPRVHCFVSDAISLLGIGGDWTLTIHRIVTERQDDTAHNPASAAEAVFGKTLRGTRASRPDG